MKRKLIAAAAAFVFGADTSCAVEGAGYREPAGQPGAWIPDGAYLGVGASAVNRGDKVRYTDIGLSDQSQVDYYREMATRDYNSAVEANHGNADDINPPNVNFGDSSADYLRLCGSNTQLGGTLEAGYCRSLTGRRLFFGAYVGLDATPNYDDCGSDKATADFESKNAVSYGCLSRIGGLVPRLGVLIGYRLCGAEFAPYAGVCLERRAMTVYTQQWGLDDSILDYTSYRTINSLRPAFLVGIMRPLGGRWLLKAELSFGLGRSKTVTLHHDAKINYGDIKLTNPEEGDRVSMTLRHSTTLRAVLCYHVGGGVRR